MKTQFTFLLLISSLTLWSQQSFEKNIALVGGNYFKARGINPNKGVALETVFRIKKSIFGAVEVDFGRYFPKRNEIPIIYADELAGIFYVNKKIKEKNNFLFYGGGNIGYNYLDSHDPFNPDFTTINQYKSRIWSGIQTGVIYTFYKPLFVKIEIPFYLIELDFDKTIVESNIDRSRLSYNKMRNWNIGKLENLRLKVGIGVYLN